MYKRLLMLICIVLSGQKAYAWDPIARCKEEPFGPEHAEGRNAWAEKCGYIQSGQATVLDSMRLFVTFERSRAPGSRDEACSDRWGQVVGTCLQNGCYGPTERMLFGGRYMPLSQAAAEDVPTVSALSNLEFSASGIKISEEPIAMFVAGNTNENLCIITVESGRRIQVTLNHPLVSEEARIIFAADIKPFSTRLMLIDGVETVTDVQHIAFEGFVWNVMPKSDKTSANILVAEDFLNGSVRFQEEWSADESRLFLRHHLDVSQF